MAAPTSRNHARALEQRANAEMNFSASDLGALAARSGSNTKQGLLLNQLIDDLIFEAQPNRNEDPNHAQTN